MNLPRNGISEYMENHRSPCSQPLAADIISARPAGVSSRDDQCRNRGRARTPPPTSTQAVHNDMRSTLTRSTSLLDVFPSKSATAVETVLGAGTEAYVRAKDTRVCRDAKDDKATIKPEKKDPDRSLEINSKDQGHYLQQHQNSFLEAEALRLRNALDASLDEAEALLGCAPNSLEDNLPGAESTNCCSFVKSSGPFAAKKQQNVSNRPSLTQPTSEKLELQPHYSRLAPSARLASNQSSAAENAEASLDEHCLTGTIRNAESRLIKRRGNDSGPEDTSTDQQVTQEKVSAETQTGWQDDDRALSDKMCGHDSSLLDTLDAFESQVRVLKRLIRAGPRQLGERRSANKAQPIRVRHHQSGHIETFSSLTQALGRLETEFEEIQDAISSSSVTEEITRSLPFPKSVQSSAMLQKQVIRQRRKEQAWTEVANMFSS